MPDNPAKRLTRVREKIGLQQKEIAARIGVSPGTWGFAERGDRAPSKALLAGLSNDFHVNISWVLTGQGDMFDNPLRRNPRESVFYHRGSSMAPTINDGDLVFFDTTVTSPDRKELFAVNMDDESTAVKWLEVNMDDQSLIISCENPDFRTIIVPSHKRDNVVIKGRVTAIKKFVQPISNHQRLEELQP